jgi:ketosteroid isomerase-like protein
MRGVVPRSDLAAALDRVAAALAAMGTGDPAPYAALWPDSNDVTLFGAWGPIERGHDAATTTFTWVVRRFSDGALAPRHDVIGVSGDLACTVGFEHVEVRVDGGEPVGAEEPVTSRDLQVFVDESAEAVAA